MGSDLMSRQYLLALQDTEDYRLKPEIFSHLAALYGNFDVDMFANADNSLCSQYVSRLADIGSTPSCIDAHFQSHWGTAFYAFPPVDDAYLALDHILQQRDARGLLIVVPLWVRLNTYTRLFPDGGHFIPQVRGWSLLSADCFEAGPIGHASFLRPDKGGHRTPFIALLINTSDHAKMEYSDIPKRFCLKAYYGDPSSCKQCRPPPY